MVEMKFPVVLLTKPRGLLKGILIEKLTQETYN